MKRTNRFLQIAVATGITFGATSSALAASATLAAFVDAYRCEVMARLVAIQSDRESADVRFLTVRLTKKIEKTVTCVFIENDTRMMCETASAADAKTEAERRAVTISKTGTKALEKLGFQANEKVGNFQQFVDLKQPEDIAGVADLMLRALYVGYGVRSPEPGVSTVGPQTKMDAELIAACRQESEPSFEKIEV